MQRTEREKSLDFLFVFHYLYSVIFGVLYHGTTAVIKVQGDVSYSGSDDGHNHGLQHSVSTLVYVSAENIMLGNMLNLKSEYYNCQVINFSKHSTCKYRLFIKIITTRKYNFIHTLAVNYMSII